MLDLYGQLGVFGIRALKLAWAQRRGRIFTVFTRQARIVSSRCVSGGKQRDFRRTANGRKISEKKPPSAWRTLPKTYYFPPRTFEYSVRVVAEDTRSPASDESPRVTRCRNSIGRLGPTRPRERDIKRLPFASAAGHSDFRDTTPPAYCHARLRFYPFSLFRDRSGPRPKTIGRPMTLLRTGTPQIKIINTGAKRLNFIWKKNTSKCN